MTDTYHDYLVEYPFEGEVYGFRISARSQGEAEARVKQLPWAVVKGQIALMVPVKTGGIIEQILKFWASRRQRRGK